MSRCFDDKVMALAEKIWDSINEVDFDPMHPSFSSLDDPVKDEVIRLSGLIVDAVGMKVVDDDC